MLFKSKYVNFRKKIVKMGENWSICNNLGNKKCAKKEVSKSRVEMCVKNMVIKIGSRKLGTKRWIKKSCEFFFFFTKW